MMWHTLSGAVTALTITARQFQVLAPAFAAMSGLRFVIFLWTRLREYPSSVAISRTAARQSLRRPRRAAVGRVSFPGPGRLYRLSAGRKSVIPLTMAASRASYRGRGLRAD